MDFHSVQEICGQKLNAIIFVLFLQQETQIEFTKDVVNFWNLFLQAAVEADLSACSNKNYTDSWETGP